MIVFFFFFFLFRTPIIQCNLYAGSGCRRFHRPRLIQSQENGLAESTNKTLQNILKKFKIVNENRTNLETKLQRALWAYWTTYKTSIWATPFRLAFGLEAIMPIEIRIPSLCVQVREWLSEQDSERVRLEKLCELEEHRILSLIQMELEQRRRKAFVNRHRKGSEKSSGSGNRFCFSNDGWGTRRGISGLDGRDPIGSRRSLRDRTSWAP